MLHLGNISVIPAIFSRVCSQGFLFFRIVQFKMKTAAVIQLNIFLDKIMVKQDKFVCLKSKDQVAW